MCKFVNEVATAKPNYEQAVKRAIELRDKYGLELVDIVTEQYTQRLEALGFHGIPHWERVLINGLMLKQMLPDRVCEDTLFLFALFHDSKRENEGSDFLHGIRGGHYFRTCVEEGFIDMRIVGSEPKAKTVYTSVVKACANHTSNLFDGNPKVAACFDADRLDLNRVRVYPDITKLNYQTAISEQLIYECSERALRMTDTPIFRRER